jgi:hypothetical protein
MDLDFLGPTITACGINIMGMLYELQFNDEPTFKTGDRVFVKPLKMEAVVIRQQKCYDGDEVFWGNVELQYDDGVKGISNSWQLEKL